MKPWERYGQPAQAKPWEQYQQSTQQDPMLELSDLTTRRAQGEQGLDKRIAELRQQTGVSGDVGRSVTPVEADPTVQVGKEFSPMEQAINIATGPNQIGSSLRSFGRGIQQGATNVGQGVLGFLPEGAQDWLGEQMGLQQGEFEQALEQSRDIEQAKTEAITKDAPISGFVGELAGEVAALPVPAAKTIKGATGLGAGLGALVAEGRGDDPVTGAIIGGAAGGAFKGVEKFIRGAIDTRRAARLEIADQLRRGEPKAGTAKYELIEGLENAESAIRVDKKATEAIRQGFGEDAIASIKASSKNTKKQFNQMLDIFKTAKDDAEYRLSNRPTDVVGDSIAKRYKAIINVNRNAGREIDRVAKRFKGQKVDFEDLSNNFVGDLERIGVTIDDKLKPSFKGSEVQGVKPAENLIKNVIKRLKDVDNVDALALHRMKRFIDNQVTFGKSKGGVTGKTEGILKKLRSNINERLQEFSPEYKKANTDYSETIRLIDEVQGLSDKRLDLTSAEGKQALGTLSRRIMGNAQSRPVVIQSLNSLDELTRKHGAKFSDNIYSQIVLADELDRVFGTTASTGFEGGIARGTQVPTSAREAGLEIARTGIERIRGINEDNAIKALEELLKGL